MPVTAETTIHDLVDEYPYLLDWLVAYNSHFSALKNPALFKTMARVAKIETAASMANVDADKLLDDIRTEIATHEIAAEETANAPAAPVDPEVAAAAPGSAQGHHPQAARRNARRAGQGGVRPADRRRRLGRDRPHGAGAHRRGHARRRRPAAVRRARDGVQGGARREAVSAGRGGPPDRRLHARERRSRPSSWPTRTSCSAHWRPPPTMPTALPCSRPSRPSSASSPRSTRTTRARRTSSSRCSRRTASRGRPRSCGRSTTTSAAASRPLARCWRPATRPRLPRRCPRRSR